MEYNGTSEKLSSDCNLQTSAAKRSSLLDVSVPDTPSLRVRAFRSKFANFVLKHSFSEVPKMDTRQAVLATLAYFDLFDFPLRADEIENYLLKCESSPEIALEDVLIKLLESREVDFCDGYFSLPGRGGDHGTGRGEKLTKIRKEKEEISKVLWAKVEKYRFLLEGMPDVKMVAVCNNLAFGNATEKSDIDIFIVSERDRLYTARTFAAALTHFTGTRRHGNKIAGRFCLSFFADEDFGSPHVVRLSSKMERRPALRVHS